MFLRILEKLQYPILCSAKIRQSHTHTNVFTLLSHLLSSLDSLENFSIEVFHIESFIYFFIHYLITVLIYICVRLSLRYFIVKLLNSVSFIFPCSSQAFSSSQLLDLSQLHHYFTICHNSYFFFLANFNERMQRIARIRY